MITIAMIFCLCAMTIFFIGLDTDKDFYLNYKIENRGMIFAVIIFVVLIILYVV